MNIEHLETKTDVKIKSYIQDFNSEKVVLDNYFLFTKNNFLKDSSLYTDDEIRVILHLTDKEYADLVSQYLSSNDAVDLTSEIEKNKTRISELEKKISQSRELEDSSIKIIEYKKELEELEKKLESVKDVQEKYEETLKNYNQFSHLKKFDISKIHEDLVSITSERKDLESRIFDFKIEKIQSSKTVEYNKGKIVLAFSLGIGIFLVGCILSLLESPFSLVSLTWGFGLLLAFGLLITSRTKIDGGFTDAPNNINALKQRLEELDADKTKILNVLNLKSAEDFFNIKAQFSSYSKSLDYLNEQRTRLLEGLHYKDIEDRKSLLQSEIKTLEQELQNKDLVLKPEEYLSIRREIDFLKLNESQLKNNSAISKDDIPAKLEQIKSELSQKLPDFCAVLKSSFKSSFNSIKSTIDNYQDDFKLSLVQINAEGDGFDSLNTSQKILVEFCLFKVIYGTNFVFIFPHFSLMDEESKNIIKKLSEETSESECRFYSID